ncbi:hypothetical protein I6F11_17660 [Ensifer sp. NBAIM29]|nr:hypothetical protein [Ensifer sp. NBAIM29]
MVFNQFSAFGGASPEVIRPPQGAPRVGETADPIDRLPAEAQSVLADLRERVDDLYALLMTISEKKQEAWHARGEAEGAYKMLTNAEIAVRNGRSHIYSADHPAAVSAKAKWDKAARIAQELADKYDALGARLQAQRRLLDKIESYIRAAGDLTASPALKLKMPAVDRLAAEVERVRAEIAELAAEKHAINSAAFTSAEAKARARAEIEALAEKGRPRVLDLIDHGPRSGLTWPHLITQSRNHGMGLHLPGDELRAFTELDGSGLAVLAWLHRDALVQAIEAEIDAVAEDENALSTEERAANLAALDLRILGAERIEAALVAASGGSIDHREDISPLAVLGVDVPSPRRED